MASLYKRGKIIWIKYRNAEGCVVRDTLRLEWANPEHLQKARVTEAEKTLLEIKDSAITSDSAWKRWVIPYLELRCAGKPDTLRNYRLRWRAIDAFLAARGARMPSQITFLHGQEYIPWRTQPQPSLKNRKACHNIARGELMLLSMLLDHAVKCGYCTTNPLSRMRIKRVKAAQRPEIPEADIQIIRQALLMEPEWMAVQFEIGLYTGCRIGETRIAWEDVDFEERALTFRGPKGGRDFTVPINPALMPLFERLRAAGKNYTHESRKNPSYSWNRFFVKMKMPYSFHCLRVTFISRGRRSGIDRWTMMKLVNHASATVHEIYNRWELRSDLRPAIEKMQFPPQLASESKPAPNLASTSQPPAVTLVSAVSGDNNTEPPTPSTTP